MNILIVSIPLLLLIGTKLTSRMLNNLTFVRHVTMPYKRTWPAGYRLSINLCPSPSVPLTLCVPALASIVVPVCGVRLT